MRFKGKTAIVTGAGRGIGRSIARTLGAEGATVVVVSRTKSEVEETARLINDAGGRAIPYPADISDEKTVVELVRSTKEQEGSVDILVNTVGYLIVKNALEITADEWDAVLNANLRSVFLTCREALRAMTAQNYGKIVNFSSQLGRQGMASRTAYSAAKFGVIGLSESLAAEVKPYKININVVCPGGVDTKMVRDNFPPGDYSKLMKPEDLTPVVLFLCSDEGGAIKGKVIEAYDGQDLAGYADDEEFRWIIRRDT